MRKTIFLILLVPLLVIYTATCSKDNDGTDGSGDGNGDEGGGDNNSGGSNGTDNGSNNGGGVPLTGIPDYVDFDVCGRASTGMEAVQTRVMILEDRSGSMRDNNKWGMAMSAIEAMVTGFDSEIAFGIDFFPYGNDSVDCSVSDSVSLDVDLGNADDILSIIADVGISRSTPLLLAIENYMRDNHAPVFLDGNGVSYLVIISDGEDSCGPDGVFMQGANAEQLGVATARLLQEQNIYTIVIGFGSAVDQRQLNEIARSGGTQFGSYIQADDEDELRGALNTIAEAVLVDCQFAIGRFDDAGVDLDLVNVYFDDAAIPRDDNCDADRGWTWADSARTIVRFCEEACQQLESGNVQDLAVYIACNPDDVIEVDIIIQ